MNGYIKYIRKIGQLDDYIYCAPMSENAIYSINYKCGSSKKIIDLPYNGIDIVKDIYTNNNLIMCVSSKGMKVFIYDKENGKSEFFEEQNDDTIWQYTCFMNGEIYFFPRDLKNDIWNFSIEYKRFKRNRYISEKLHKIQNYGIARRIFESKNELFFLITDEKKIIQYSWKDKRADVLDIPQNFEYYDMAQCGRNYYFVVKNGGKKLIKWNIDNKKIKVIDGKGSGNYVKLIPMGENTLLLCSDSACDGEELLNCDSIYQTGFSDRGKDVSNVYKHYSLLALEHGYLALPWHGDYFVMFDREYKYQNKKKISIPLEIYFEKDVVEEGAYGLTDFIGYICFKG